MLPSVGTSPDALPPAAPSPPPSSPTAPAAAAINRSSVLFPEPLRPTRTTRLLRVRSSVTPSSNRGPFLAFPEGLAGTILAVTPAGLPVFAHLEGGGFDIVPRTASPGRFTVAVDDEDDEDEGNANDIARHWTTGASMAQARGVTSGNRKMVSLSTCAAKLHPFAHARRGRGYRAVNLSQSC